MRVSLAALVGSVILSSMNVFAVDESKLKDFEAKLRAAIEDRDLKVLSDLYYREGAAEHILDFSVFVFESNLNRGGTVGEIEFLDLDDSKVGPERVEKMTKGERMNGNLYRHNLNPVIFCAVTFTREKGKSTRVLPLGMTPEGELKFSLQVKVEEE